MNIDDVDAELASLKIEGPYPPSLIAVHALYECARCGTPGALEMLYQCAQDAIKAARDHRNERISTRWNYIERQKATAKEGGKSKRNKRDNEIEWMFPIFSEIDSRERARGRKGPGRRLLSQLAKQAVAATDHPDHYRKGEISEAAAARWKELKNPEHAE